MIVTFFIFRILVFPYLYWRYAIHAGIQFLEVPFKIPLHCNLGCLSVLVLQAYWMWLMIRGAFRVFYKIYHMKKSWRVDCWLWAVPHACFTMYYNRPLLYDIVTVTLRFTHGFSARCIGYNMTCIGTVMQSNKNKKKSSFKSKENIHNKEDGSYYIVSANKHDKG